MMTVCAWCRHVEPFHSQDCSPHLRHPSVPLPHLRDLDEETPGWWKRNQTPLRGLRNVSVGEIVGSACGSGWQFNPDWTPRAMALDYRFQTVFSSLERKGFDPELDGSPIELIKFQKEYWVTEGHRRVSVARILGIRYVRAEITLLGSTSPCQPKTRIRSGSSKTMEVTE